MESIFSYEKDSLISQRDILGAIGAGKWAKPLLATLASHIGAGSRPRAPFLVQLPAIGPRQAAQDIPKCLGP